ncbi:CheY-like chemotaxis protein [Bradyrhizobium sp. i1.4.4]|uniref:response regulator n=1 Tax=Bradyrhizobium TaxID=374 RepID=UPI001FD8AEF7|nr:response regulator [Bradyrhizobium japonicum]
MQHTVLLVDDDASVREVIAGMLEDLGCSVVCAESGVDALDQLASNDRISILITDINMPSMVGMSWRTARLACGPRSRSCSYPGASEGGTVFR